MATKQSNTRASALTPNNNISFPIGTILAVKNFFRKLELPSIFKKFKSRGLDLSSLTEGMVSYRLTENLSLSKASDWMNRPEVREIFDLEEFNQKTLYRALRIIGSNREEIIMDLQDHLFGTYEFVNGGLIFPTYGGLKFPTHI